MSQTVRTILEQGRAKYAYECAEKGASNKAKASEYKAYSKKVPMMIKTNGLGATLAFMKAKRGTYGVIYNQISIWLAQSELFKFDETSDFVAYIISCESSEYRAATIEVLAFFNWLRRFAEGLIDGE